MHLSRTVAHPKLNYAVRTVPRIVAIGAIDWFDNQLKEVFNHTINRKAKSQLELPETALLQKRLPVKDGGLGLVPYRNICDAAYIGAMAFTVKSLTSRMAAILQTTPTLPTAVAITAALKSIHDSGATEFAATTAADFVTEVRSDAMKDKLRHVQTKIMVQIHAKAAKQEMSAHDRTRLTSCSDANASQWLSKLPTEHAFQLNNNDLSIAIRTRIGIPTSDSENLICSCGTRITTANPDHYYTCRKLLATTIPRHNHFLSAVQTIATAAGSEVVREYRTTWQEYNRKRQMKDLRPDACITGINHKFLIDVSGTTPTAKSIMKRDPLIAAAGAAPAAPAAPAVSPAAVHVPAGRRRSAPAAAVPVGDAKSNVCAGVTPLFAAQRRELIKHDKYRNISQVECATFHAVVFETYGALGKDTMRLLDELNTAHKMNSENSNWSLKKWGINVLSFAVQRGNARLVFEAYRLDRRSPDRI